MVLSKTGLIFMNCPDRHIKIYIYVFQGVLTRKIRLI